MHWPAIIPSGSNLFTDHNKPVFLFEPLRVVLDILQSTLRSPPMGNASPHVRLRVPKHPETGKSLDRPTWTLPCLTHHLENCPYPGATLFHCGLGYDGCGGPTRAETEKEGSPKTDS